MAIQFRPPAYSSYTIPLTGLAVGTGVGAAVGWGVAGVSGDAAGVTVGTASLGLVSAPASEVLGLVAWQLARTIPNRIARLLPFTSTLCEVGPLVATVLQTANPVDALPGGSMRPSGQTEARRGAQRMR
ncbi:MAG TPA: hypothetical protein VKR30_12490 [Candidatus Limnocylindrales bacterium]|nr:hypothetical protein [Candidatus Limnocylindrales bacterium]